MSVHQPHSESGTLSGTQTHQHCVKLILNKIHQLKRKKKEKKMAQKPILPFMEGLKIPHVFLGVMKSLFGLDLYGDKKNNGGKM